MKNRIIIMILSFLLVFSFNANLFAETENTLKEIISIPLGNNQYEIAVKKLQGGSTLGPDSFAVLNDNTILVLDSAGKKILKYIDEKIVSKYDLSFCNQPKDMVVTLSGEIYILDISPGVIYSLTNEGNIKHKVKLPDVFPVHRILHLGLSASEELTIRLFTGEEFFLGDLSEGVVKSYEGYEFLNSSQRIKTEKINEQTFKVQGLSNIITVVGNGLVREVGVIGIDKSSNAYVYNIDLNPNSSKVQGERYLSKYDKAGKLLGRIHLQTDKTFAPTRDMFITESGKVYWMAVTDSQTKIFEVTFNNIEPLKEFPVTHTLNEASSNVQPHKSTSYDRIELIGRADTQINYSWVYNTANGQNPPSGVTKPTWLASTPYGTRVTGLPYCWGGFDSTYSSTRPSSWDNFGDAMGQGKFAGNVSASGTYKEDTAGPDCAGFISAVAGFSSRSSTYDIYDNDSTEVPNLIDRLTMDIFIDRPSHVMFYFGDLSGQGISTKEATTAGPEKAKNYSRTWTWLDTNGYELRRLNGL